MGDLPESNLERAKRLTQAEVDAGRLHPWVMGDEEQRARFTAAKDRRAAFAIVKEQKRDA
jgi:hypothetical protein